MKRTVLREGAGDALFVIPGMGGNGRELAAVVDRLDGDREVIALNPIRGDEDPQDWTVESIAARIVAMIRADQPRGPYRILGYSFGGSLALEAGSTLRADGEIVEFLGVIDTVIDTRYWPARQFATATIRRLFLHVASLLRRPPRQAWDEFDRLARRLVRRLNKRFVSPEETAHAHQTPLDANLTAAARWKPSVFDGRVVYFSATQSDFGLDLTELWRPYLSDLVVVRIPGHHLDLVRTAEGAQRLAAAIDRELASGARDQLRVLVATTFHWSGAARLAAELQASGYLVEAVAPSRNALHHVAAVNATYPLRVLRPLSSLVRALERSPADILMPFDDRMRQALDRVYRDADPSTARGVRLRKLIERSFGDPASYARLYSRTDLMTLATDSAMPCPPTAALSSAADLSRWLAEHDGPNVLKADGSWGGRGVRVVRTRADADRAWQRLSRPPSLPRSLKRLLVEHDPWPIRAWVIRQPQRLSVQAYIDGRPGNLTAACLEGRLLAAVSAEVLQTAGPTGPATVLRIIDNQEMLAAARKIITSMKLSGLCGFDFILENGTDRAYLLELNPRATPTSHLQGADGSDPLVSLRRALGDSSSPSRPVVHHDGTIALFPQELRRDPSGRASADMYQDIPWHAPDLVRLTLPELRDPARSRIRRELAKRIGDSLAPQATQ